MHLCVWSNLSNPVKMCYLSVRHLGLPSNLTLLEVSNEKWRKVNISFSYLKSVPGVTLQRRTEQSVSDSDTLALVWATPLLTACQQQERCSVLHRALFAYSSKLLILNVSSVQIASNSTFSSAILLLLPGCMCDDTYTNATDCIHKQSGTNLTRSRNVINSASIILLCVMV